MVTTIEDAPATSPQPPLDASPGAPGSHRRWREWIIPHSVLGMVMLILALAVGAAGSGVAFYSYYEYRLSTNEFNINRFVKGFDERFNTAVKTIDAERENAKADVEKALEPLRRIRVEGTTLNNLVKRAAPSIWLVETLDEAGQPSVGTAFAVATTESQTLLVTSFSAVRAATSDPGPEVFLSKGKDRDKATLRTWDDSKDLALLVLNKGDQDVLKFAPEKPPLSTGNQIFAISALGSAGGSITQGFVTDVSAAGIQHDASIGPQFQGGPMVNLQGEVIAVASRSYSPVGFVTSDVFFSPRIRDACQKILRCPDGNVEAGEATP